MSELLEKAIADARAIRATAYANAREMLEEAFAPRLERMLSEKLKEELGDDEQSEEGTPDVTDVTPEQPAPAPADASVSVDVPEPAAPVAPVADLPVVATTPATPGQVATAVAPAAPEQVPDASAQVSDVPADETEIAPDAPVAPEQPVAPAQDDDTGGDVDEAEIDEILKELGLTDAEKKSDPTAGSEEIVEEGDEEIDLQELLGGEQDADGLGKDANEISDEEIEKIIGGITESKDKDDDDCEKEEVVALKEEILSLKKSLDEHENTVKYLRGRINEVNVLTSKLFHMSKVFKEHSLTNEQKNRVVEAFDLTQSVRETKLVYTTLTETFNSGKKTVDAKRIAPSAITTLTEGLASKAIASTKPAKEVLMENADKLRFQKLAGIKR